MLHVFVYLLSIFSIYMNLCIYSEQKEHSTRKNNIIINSDYVSNRKDFRRLFYLFSIHSWHRNICKRKRKMKEGRIFLFFAYFLLLVLLEDDRRHNGRYKENLIHIYSIERKLRVLTQSCYYCDQEY